MSDREKIPYVDLMNFKGLATKASPDTTPQGMLRVAENCDFFETYGALAKMPGSARILSSIYKESAVVKPISWLGFYKAPDLDGQILRHTLVSAGTTLARLNSGSVTGADDVLETGRTSGLVHSADRLGRFMFISNYDVDQIGIGDNNLKYDGAVTSKWGLESPGSLETVREEFDDATDWTAVNCTATDSAVSTFDGDAISLEKSGTSSTTFSVQKNLDADFSPIGDTRGIADAIANRVNFQLYIPRGTLIEKFATSGRALSVYVGDASLTNNWRFDFEIGSLLEGWNQINLDFTTSAPATPTTAANPVLGVETGTFDPDTDDIVEVRFEFVLNAISTTISGILLDRLVSLDEGAPVVNAGSGSASFTGTYQYKVAFVSKYGHLSNVGPSSISLTTAADTAIDLTDIPVSTDPQVIERRLYRTVAGGSIFLFLDQIFDNVTTTYTDETADGSLGNETPPQAGDFSDDNSPPPKGGIVKVWKRTVFMAGDPQNPDKLYFSEDDEPESFPLINEFDLDEKITAIYETYSGVVVETETSKWQIIGDNPDFNVDKIIKGAGCVGRRAAGQTRVEGYAVDRDGMRLYDLSTLAKISEPIRDKYDALSKPNIELIHTAHSKARNLFLQFNPNASGEYDSIFGYIYPIDQVREGNWLNVVTPSAANLNFLDAEEIEDSNGDFRLYAGGDDGMIYELFCSASKNWVDANGTTYAIDTNIQTPYMRLGELGVEAEGVTGKIEPQFIEIRASGDASTWNITLDMAKGSDQASPTETKTIAMQFGTNNSRLVYPIPSPPLGSQTYIRISAQNNQKDVFSRLLAVRLYFHTRPMDGAVTTVDTV